MFFPFVWSRKPRKSKNSPKHSRPKPRADEHNPVFRGMTRSYCITLSKTNHEEGDMRKRPIHFEGTVIANHQAREIPNQRSASLESISQIARKREGPAKQTRTA